jgi:hypothetical protein
MTITEAALVKRINRKLAPQWQAIRKPRPGRYVDSLGPYYLLDVNRNVIESYGMGVANLIDMARELRVLRESEVIVED